MSQPQADIDALHAAIKAGLADQYPTATVDFYPRPGERITTPAILLDMDDIVVDEPEDIGTEQLSARINFNAYAVLDYKSGKKQAVKTMAGAVLAYIRGRRWGQPVGAAMCNGAYPDIIQGREDDYEVMRIEFSHEVLLGADYWAEDPDAIVPSELNASALEEEHKIISPCQ